MQQGVKCLVYGFWNPPVVRNYMEQCAGPYIITLSVATDVRNSDNASGLRYFQCFPRLFWAAGFTISPTALLEIFRRGIHNDVGSRYFGSRAGRVTLHRALLRICLRDAARRNDERQVCTLTISRCPDGEDLICSPATLCKSCGDTWQHCLPES